MRGEWEKVGIICVDSGMCWIGDPCNVMAHEEKKLDPALGKTWHDFCALVERGGIDGHAKAAQVNFEPGHAGLGVCTRSGPGDGDYEVFTRKAADGRLLEVKIVFEEE